MQSWTSPQKKDCPSSCHFIGRPNDVAECSRKHSFRHIPTRWQIKNYIEKPKACHSGRSRRKRRSGYYRFRYRFIASFALLITQRFASSVSLTQGDFIYNNEYLFKTEISLKNKSGIICSSVKFG